jgi:hypothetical protein
MCANQRSAALFGINQADARHMISTNCASLLLHAEARRLRNGVLNIAPLDSVDEKWKIGNTDDVLFFKQQLAAKPQQPQQAQPQQAQARQPQAKQESIFGESRKRKK